MRVRQATATLLTTAVAVPLPFCTVQVWPVGWVCTVTLYALPAFTVAANVKAVAFAATLRLSAALLRNTSPVPVNPLMEPPTV